MIDFKNGEVFKLSETPIASVHELVQPLLVHGEGIQLAFKTVRDMVAFTNKRVIAVNVQGVTGKKKDFTSLPYAKVQAFSVETAGHFDLDSELELWFSGLGKVRFEFKGACRHPPHRTDPGELHPLSSRRPRWMEVHHELASSYPRLRDDKFPRSAVERHSPCLTMPKEHTNRLQAHSSASSGTYTRYSAIAPSQAYRGLRAIVPQHFSSSTRHKMDYRRLMRSPSAGPVLDERHPGRHRLPSAAGLTAGPAGG